MKKSISLFVVLLTLSGQGYGCMKEDESQTRPVLNIQVPTEGNSWIFEDPSRSNPQITDYKGNSWNDTAQVIRTWFRVSASGEIGIGIRASISVGKSIVRTTFNGISKEIEISSLTPAEIYIGTFAIPAPGYYYLDVSGLSKQGSSYAEISDLLLGGAATQKGVNFSDKEYFYWGRRGPSVHLSYTVPEKASAVKWFYNEVTVPEGNDVTGSYFMANGFSEGYFGFQVNSGSERRILFSVWSPYQTDNPASIPPEYRVVLLRKGDETVIREFGNEGSGGQSFLRYQWKAGNTYRFLLRTEPAEGEVNKTDYTAWFYAPETDHWMLIASWRRPFTSTYTKGLHSFLENFITGTGPLKRQAFYGNQWVCDTNCQWHELTRVKFTADATARNNARLDYAGGLVEDSNRFFLKNCGFFNETTPVDSWFTRKGGGAPPDIEFSTLP